MGLGYLFLGLRSWGRWGGDGPGNPDSGPPGLSHMQEGQGDY